MENHLTVSIDPSIYELIRASTDKKESFCHDQLGVNHLLSALMEIEAELMWELLGEEVKTAIEASLQEKIGRGETGATLEVDETIAKIRIRAFKRGDDTATKRDLACITLADSSFDLQSKRVVEQHSQVPRPSKLFPPKKKLSIPTLLQFGIDLTRQAREGKLLPVVERNSEIQLMIETLCRRTKRNPVLVGGAGVGKTAIVEGFAQKIIYCEVPEILRDSTVVLLQPSLIVAGGGGICGELEKRMNAILSEASQDGVILFIDEVHAIIGAGGASGTADIASLMKPALARGDIACIAATTDNEYRRYIEPDTALERRFQPIRVSEMSTVQVFVVLQALRDDLKQSRGVDVSDDVLRRLIDYAEKYMRNRTFPDKAVDLLEQCVANALARCDSDVDVSEADNVVQRMVGIPLDIGTRIAAMRKTLAERRLLSEAGIEALAGRLQVTMRGLDIRMVRPNAVLLLAGNAAKHGQALAETICNSLFESVDRIVKIDMGRFTSQHDITLLLGAPPSYVGYNESLPIHRIKQYPWCVALFDNVDAGHQSIQQVLGQAFTDGFFVDGQNRKIYLSDVVVVMTAPGIEQKNARTMGFQLEGSEPDGDRALVRKYIDVDIVNSIDVICFDVGEKGKKWGEWLRSGILNELSERFSKLGVNLLWDNSILEWIDTYCTDYSCQSDLERLIDERLSPAILSGANGLKCHARSIVVKYFNSRIVVEEVVRAD